MATPSLNPGEESRTPGHDELVDQAASPALTEDLALALLKRADLPPAAIDALIKNSGLMKSRKVALAIAMHTHSPRHVSLPLIKQFFTLELMRIALNPATPADIKRVADDAILNRIKTIASGERMALARQASGRVAGALLLDAEARIVHAALENARLTEAAIVRALMRHDSPAHFVEAVCHHAKWSLRHEVRLAALRNEKTPLASALTFAHALRPAELREILNSSHLRSNVRDYLLQELERRCHG